MSNSLANGKKFRTLNIIDQYNRKCMEIAINYTLPSRKVIEILQRPIDEYGKPLGIRTDNGPDFTSCIYQNWMDKTILNGLKFKKENHSKMQSFNDSTELIVRTFLMQTCSFHYIMFTK